MPLPLAAIPAQPRENEIANAVNESAEALELLARRRSTKARFLVEPGPSAAETDALIALAARVPDHGKLGPWRFVVIAGEARDRAGQALAHAMAGTPESATAQLLLRRAPVCVMVVSSPVEHPKIPAWEQQLSAGAAAFSLLLSAHAMGYAGCWLTEWPAYDTRARAALGLAAHERIAGFVYLGTASEPAIERVRADIASRVTRF